MQNYLDQKRSLADRLRLIGNPVYDADLQLFILHGLSVEYDSLVVSLNSKPNDVPFNELAELLLTHEQRLQQHALTASGVSISSSLQSVQTFPQANLASSLSTSDLSSQYADLMTQFQAFLASKSNSWRDKPFLKPNPTSTNFSDKPVCQLCSKRGHTADRCYKRFDNSYRPPPPRPPPRQRHPQPQALLVQSNLAPPETWYLDSGALAHISPDLNCFTTYQPYTGADQLRVGDGQGLKNSHIGSTCLVTNSTSLVLNNVLHVPSISKSLLSVSRLVADNPIYVEFNDSSCLVKD
jgi:gag-polypeptide of LTR copia-type